MASDTDPAEQFPTIESLIEAARHTLSRERWDHASGGAETESTIRRNREAFSRIGFKPRLMRDVRGRSTETSFLGAQVRLPVFLAPVGSVSHYHPDAALAVGRVAQRAQTAAFVGTAAEPGVRQVRQETSAPLVYQLYVFGDRAWIERTVDEAIQAECAAICVTVDATVSGIRDRNRRNRFVSRREEIPLEWRENFTWADFDWLRSISALPLMIKGITTAEDAALAVEHGADVVYVSNHGGRQLDYMPAAIEVLPEVVAAVAGRAEVIVDSGFVRGSDVVKALALGATAVGIGKLMVWSLAAGGEDGLARALELLQGEMLNVMALLGVNRIDELGPELLRPLTPVGDSGWVGHLPALND